jgi:two-component system, chemotaxis family, chemotaxis protein CheY
MRNCVDLAYSPSTIMAKALIVDDSKAVRMVIARSMRQFGYDTLEAANGAEGLNVLKAEGAAVRLLLADWNMPEMNGLEMLKRMRQDPNNDKIAVIMVTSECDTDQMIAAMSAGANEYVMKPFTHEILQEKLQLVGALNEVTE